MINTFNSVQQRTKTWFSAILHCWCCCSVIILFTFSSTFHFFPSQYEAIWDCNCFFGYYSAVSTTKTPKNQCFSWNVVLFRRCLFVKLNEKKKHELHERIAMKNIKKKNENSTSAATIFLRSVPSILCCNNNFPDFWIKMRWDIVRAIPLKCIDHESVQSGG